MTAPGETAREPPYGVYAALTATFLGAVAIVAVAGARRRRLLPAAGPFDLAVLGLATFKASRTLARDEVTSFIREPFVEGRTTEDETPLQTGGARQAIGELVTCSRCVGTWVAGGLATTQILAPRFGRVLTWTLAAAALNDWLQAGFAMVTTKANHLERQPE
jgi:hypothetical protein